MTTCYVRHFAVILDATGASRAEEVPPGKYELTIMFYSGEFGSGTMPKTLGLVRREVIVPDSSSQEDDSAADISALEAKLEPMPAITMSGKAGGQ